MRRNDDELKRAIERLKATRDSRAALEAYCEDDDEPTQPQIIVEAGGVVNVGDTGKWKPVKPEDKITLGVRAVEGLVKIANSWKRVVALGMILAAGAFVAWLVYG